MSHNPSMLRRRLYTTLCSRHRLGNVPRTDSKLCHPRCRFCATKRRFSHGAWGASSAPQSNMVPSCLIVSTTRRSPDRIIVAYLSYRRHTYVPNLCPWMRRGWSKSTSPGDPLSCSPDQRIAEACPRRACRTKYVPFPTQTTSFHRRSPVVWLFTPRG